MEEHDAYWCGAEMYNRGASFIDNPYAYRTKDCNEWDRGFKEARDAEYNEKQRSAK